MSLTFLGPRGTVEARWITYALLRDNVQHHLEASVPSDGFTALHSVAAALGGSRVRIDAARLHDELARARVDLVARPVSQLAISSRTRAVIQLTWPPPSTPSTEYVSDLASVPWVSADVQTLGDVFGSLIDSLLAITADATPSETVDVFDT